jgi:hypothetical protein
MQRCKDNSGDGVFKGFSKSKSPTYFLGEEKRRPGLWGRVTQWQHLLSKWKI